MTKRWHLVLMWILFHLVWCHAHAGVGTNTVVSKEMVGMQSEDACLAEAHALVQSVDATGVVDLRAWKAFHDCLERREKETGIQDGPDVVDTLRLQVANPGCEAINALEGADLGALYDLDVINEFLTCGLSEMTIKVPLARAGEIPAAVGNFVRELRRGGAAVNSACDSLTDCTQKVENTCGSLASPFASRAKSASLSACPTQKKGTDSTCCTGVCQAGSAVTVYCITIVVNPTT